MNPNWAEENLQTIRTLMERAALYRRALAPIMLFAGVIGTITALAGWWLRLNYGWTFCGLWLGAAVVAMSGSFFIARRQAFKDRENFWSPPTRRVAQALSPPLAAGLFLSVMLAGISDNADLSIIISLFWILFYGCAVHAAGFFMPRGMKWFGWLFIVSSCGLLGAIILGQPALKLNPHLLMGFFFGGLHLAYGVYLYLTEKKTPAA
jgi:hypothetical protein